MCPHVAYYYQRLAQYQKGMGSIAQAVQSGSFHRTTVVVYVASLHFGRNADHTHYIHLNDASPSDTFVESLREWSADMQFRVMLGGAGGAYGTLFESAASYQACYGLLIDLLTRHRDVLSGIDLDVEEPVRLDDIKMLIRDIKSDLGDEFAVTMAPISLAMETDSPGLGGFVYKDLYTDPEVGRMIDGFNVQCYRGSFVSSTFDAIVANGYAPEHLTLGMLGDEFTGADDPAFESSVRDLCRFRSAHPSLQGVVLWEFGDTRIDPVEWGTAVSAPHYFLTNAFVDQCERVVADVTKVLLLFMCHMVRHALHAMRHFFYMIDTLHMTSIEHWV